MAGIYVNVVEVPSDAPPPAPQKPRPVPVPEMLVNKNVWKYVDGIKYKLRWVIDWMEERPRFFEAFVSVNEVWWLDGDGDVEALPLSVEVKYV